MLAAICGAAIVPIMLGCDRMFYYPSRTKYDDPRAHGLKVEDVEIFSKDGTRLHGWFFKAAGDKAVGTVVHCHGNAGNVTGHFENVAWLPARGWNVLCFDYRGYGQSDGKPSRRLMIDDAHAAIDTIKRRKDVDPARIVLFGQSLGGAVGIVVGAERKDLAGIAVEGAFTSYREIAYFHIFKSGWMTVVAWWVPPVLISDGWNPIDHVQRVSPTPLLIVQGQKDEIIDPKMGERLHGAAGRNAWLMRVESAEHTDAFDGEPGARRDILVEFFERCVDKRVDEKAVEELLEKANP